MTNIVALDPVIEKHETPVPRRLKALSHGLVWLFNLLLGLQVLILSTALIVCLFFPGYVLMTSRSAGIFIGEGGGLPALKPGMTRLSDLPFITHLAGIADIAIIMLPVFFVLWHLRGLFGLYAKGIVFAQENAAHLQRIGLWLIALPFCRFAANWLFVATGGTDEAWFRSSVLQAPVLGLIVLAIALVMKFGREIEKEKDSFI